MFDPALDGYWGYTDHMVAMDVAIDVIAANPDKVEGVKISLLDKGKEIAMRRRLQLRGADRRRRAGLFRRAARHLRRHRAGGLGRARCLHPWQCRAVSRH